MTPGDPARQGWRAGRSHRGPRRTSASSPGRRGPPPAIGARQRLEPERRTCGAPDERRRVLGTDAGDRAPPAGVPRPARPAAGAWPAGRRPRRGRPQRSLEARGGVTGPPGGEDEERATEVGSAADEVVEKREREIVHPLDVVDGDQREVVVVQRAHQALEDAALVRAGRGPGLGPRARVRLAPARASRGDDADRSWLRAARAARARSRRRNMPASGGAALGHARGTASSPGPDRR